MEHARPEQGRDLARVDQPLQPGRAGGAEERRSPPAPELAVAEHRDPETADPLAERSGDPLGLGIAGPEAHDRHDIGGAHARVDALVPGQIDALDRDRDGGGEPLDQAVGLAHAREHRAVVVGVGVHVEDRRVRLDRRPDGRHGAGIAPGGEVGHRFQEAAHRRHYQSQSTSMVNVNRVGPRGTPRLALGVDVN